MEDKSRARKDRKSQVLMTLVWAASIWTEQLVEAADAPSPYRSFHVRLLFLIPRRCYDMENSEQYGEKLACGSTALMPAMLREQ
jgi:hypothetical protein